MEGDENGEVRGEEGGAELFQYEESLKTYLDTSNIQDSSPPFHGFDDKEISNLTRLMIVDRKDMEPALVKKTKGRPSAVELKVKRERELKLNVIEERRRPPPPGIREESCALDTSLPLSTSSSQSTPVSGELLSRGTSSRPSLYILGCPSIAALGVVKLPKGMQLLQRFEGLLMEKDYSSKSNIDKTKIREEAAGQLAEEVINVWKHHFGLRVIEGREFEGQQVDEEDLNKKKIIIREKHIKQKILDLHTRYKKVEGEAKRKVKRGNFKTVEEELKKDLEIPLDITKQGIWRTIKVDGISERVWLPSGKEILARSGILNWKEDLDHLTNQLTVEQPGCVERLDLRQAKRDSRKLREFMAEERQNEEAANIRKPQLENMEDESDDGEGEIDEVDLNDNFKGGEISKKKKVDIMGPVSMVADRLNLSCMEMAMTSAATVKAMGMNVADTNISVSTAWRKRTKARLEQARSIKDSFSPCQFNSLHWDGKTLTMSCGVKGNFVAIYVCGVEDGQPTQLLGIPLCPGGKGKEEFLVIKSALETWSIKKQIIVIVFDTTLSNTGEFEGVCSYLSEWMGEGVAVLWCGCRKHICELRMKWFCSRVVGDTKDPGVKLFRRFQAGFLEMERDLKEEDLLRLDLTTKPEWLQDLGKETLNWALEIEERDIFPRDDYREMLGWVIWHLGGTTKNFFPLKMPGPDHSARWMSKCIYYAKIMACYKVFEMTEEEKRQVEMMTEFVVLFYARSWFESTLAASAARSDLTFLSQILRYYRLSQIWPLLQAFYRQLWYLTGELVVMALVDEGLNIEERETMAKTLHATSRIKKTKMGKPVIPVISCFLTPVPTPPSLSSLITEDSWTLFDRLGLMGPNDWLLAPQNLWHLFTEYRVLTDFVKHLKVTNDIAERGCHLMTEFVNRVESEEAREALVQSVSYHRKLVTGRNKEDLEKV